MWTIVIEAGGKSTRMGMDKALMPFNGEPLIQRIIRRLDGVGDEMMIVANQPEPYRMLGLRVVPDVIPGSGALSGVHTALACASHPFVIITACDLPFVNAHLIREAMRHLVEEDLDVVIPRTEQGLEPFHAVYRRETCLPAAESAIRDGYKRIISWFHHVRVLELPVENFRHLDPQGITFLNVNTPEEWRLAEELAAQGE
ncbi:MAG TPA: molybdenum cofactor guanylyltransferase [Anaerolineaceae bacterium]|jgi:molybdopterin-guanine dinucleotide biosynthesis protein A|nr:molybdenum cofactor guanylyltransferase [Anaerolineaceae bacterium]HQJ02707.1 molybdenum cofactor guanylyltransferase [Anaerolineaceae bacterium]HQP59980.1 molybdenum cofactor guanylyltransferase [Anaerolineaceae bacterium]